MCSLVDAASEISPDTVMNSLSSAQEKMQEAWSAAASANSSDILSSMFSTLEGVATQLLDQVEAFTLIQSIISDLPAFIKGELVPVERVRMITLWIQKILVIASGARTSRGQPFDDEVTAIALSVFPGSPSAAGLSSSSSPSASFSSSLSLGTAPSMVASVANNALPAVISSKLSLMSDTIGTLLDDKDIATDILSFICASSFMQFVSALQKDLPAFKKLSAAWAQRYDMSEDKYSEFAVDPIDYMPDFMDQEECFAQISACVAALKPLCSTSSSASGVAAGSWPKVDSSPYLQVAIWYILQKSLLVYAPHQSRFDQCLLPALRTTFTFILLVKSEKDLAAQVDSDAEDSDEDSSEDEEDDDEDDEGEEGDEEGDEEEGDEEEGDEDGEEEGEDGEETEERRIMQTWTMKHQMKRKPKARQRALLSRLLHPLQPHLLLLFTFRFVAACLLGSPFFRNLGFHKKFLALLLFLPISCEAHSSLKKMLQL